MACFISPFLTPSVTGLALPQRAHRRASTLTACNEPPPPPPSLTKIPFPALYDAWFPPTHQLRTQAQESISRAHAAGARSLELQWPVVPNLEELAAGTLLNFEFGKHVAATLGMSASADYPLVKRYLASFCNLYWAAFAVADAEPFRTRTVWVLCTDSVSKRKAEGALPTNVRVATLSQARRDAMGDDDVVVVIDPRFDDVWKRAFELRPERGSVVFLNSQFNENYGLTGPRRGKLREVQVAYFLKRLTRGYAFYTYPGPWRACLERPDLGIEELAEYEEEPKLRELARIVREESNRRYGGLYNDRYVQGFGGRL